MTEPTSGPFSMLQMFWGNLAARPLRCALSIVAIAIQVVLVLMIVGMTSGVVDEWGKRVEGVGADVLVQPPNASIFFAFSSAVMQESFGDEIEKLPEVDDVAPTLIMTDPKSLMVIYGIDYKRFNALSKGFIFRAGGPFERSDQAIADDIVAQTRHLKVGDTVTLINRPFRISGIVAHGKGARFFVPLKTAQDLMGAEKRVSVFFVRSKGDTEGSRAEILKLDPQNRVRSMAEYVSLMSSSNLPELKPFIRTMVVLGILVSFLVVLMNMHTMVMERTREIGILKALGFTRLEVMQMLLGETTALAIAGSLVGIAVTFLTRAILKETNPSLPVQITAGWALASIGLALLGAVLGATVPAMRAATYDPVEALAYE
ncbi:MAG TPA: FtsX-like permease family protein [Candidatus Eremiobacteraceae bacterium]|nr:FtsX-like permease family protein [Candidatus Eremiobacteraceae bacterium]